MSTLPKRMRRCVVWIGLCLLSVSGLSARELFVVSTNPLAEPPYTNWIMAATNIQNAINAATNNDTIWISNGVYLLTNQITLSSVSNNYMLIRSVNGPEVTIIDANNYAGKPMTNRCLNIGSAGNNTFSGLTFANGRTTKPGGGVAFAQTTIISNCIFISNNCSGDGYGSLGGGLSGTNGIVKNSVFRDNLAEKGGGMYLWGTNFMISDCTISNNFAIYFSGGISIHGTGVVVNCAISSNQALTYGGGIGIFAGAVISNCVINGNVATNTTTWENGGGIYFGGMNITVQNCTITENVAYRGGGIFYNQGNNSTIRNCLISGNTAKLSGGGLFLYNHPVYTGLVESCTIVNNASTNQGGGMKIEYNTTNRIYIVNTVVWSNRATAASYPNINDGDTNAFAYCSAPVNFFRPDAGNLTNDPLFAGPATGNWRLTPQSPCVNTGSNQAWMSDAHDFDGHSRIDKFSGRADMGAYEYLSQGTMYSMP